MPLVYQHTINDSTKIAVWHIAEPEDFFLKQVLLQREISHPHKRLQHLAGRYLLKELYPDFPYKLIRIANTLKPFLENDRYHFSISHCGVYAAVIVSSRYRVGADVELITSKVERVKDKFLNQQEQQMLAQMINSAGIAYSAILTAAWSIKESLFKWYGNSAVDFKEHIYIEKISLQDNEGIAFCQFSKDILIKLPVHFLFFNNNCISWVLTDV